MRSSANTCAKLSEHVCKIKHKLIHFAYNYIIDSEALLFIYADSSLTAIGAALARNKGCAIAGRIHVEKLESDTDSLPNL